MPDADMIIHDLNFLYFVVRRVKSTKRISSYQESVLAYKSHDPLWESVVHQAIDHYDYVKDKPMRQKHLSF